MENSVKKRHADCHGTGRLPALFCEGDWVIDLLLGLE